MEKSRELEISIIHKNTIEYITGVNVHVNPESHKWYERLFQVFDGQYPCPICSAKYDDPALALHIVDPEIYFGLLTLKPLKMVGIPHVVSSKSAIRIFFEEYHDKLKNKEGDILAYVRSHYTITQEKMILNAIEDGEKQVAQLQRLRNCDRLEALILCIDYRYVSDIYVLATEEYKHPVSHDRILMYRPNLKKFSDYSLLTITERETDKKLNDLINNINRISEMYYNNNKHLIVTEKPKNKRVPRRKVKSARAMWAEGW